MAASTLPAPGKKVWMGYGKTRHEEEIGPCVEPCNHVDCAETRKMAATPCTICGKEIGYETRFYQDYSTGNLMHALCEERRIETNLAQRIAQQSQPEIAVGDKVARKSNRAIVGEVVQTFRATNGKLTAKVRWPCNTRIGGHGFSHSCVAFSSLVKVDEVAK